MSGAPTLIQWMILLICITILPTTTQRKISYLEHRDRLLCIYENDGCADMFHIEEGKIQCREALNHFSNIVEYFRIDCPNARDAMCRIINRGSKCTFICDPTVVERNAAAQDGFTAEPTTKTLRAVTISMRGYLNETEEEKQQRYERLRQRDLKDQELAQKKSEQIRQRKEERRQQASEETQQVLKQRQQAFQRRFQGQQSEQHERQSLRLPQQQERGQQHQFQLGANDEARLRRWQRTQILSHKRSQRQRPQ